MRTLSIATQKPRSTGSGIYLIGLIKSFTVLEHEQAVVAGVYEEDEVHSPEGTRVYPVYYKAGSLPSPIAGISNETPYESTIYSRMAEDMVDVFKGALLEKTREAMGYFRPGLILCHHLYLPTTAVREAFPQYKTAAICHDAGLHQIKKNSLERNYTLVHMKELDKMFRPYREQGEEISRIHSVPGERLEVIGSGFDDSILRYMSAQKRNGTKRLIYAGKLSEKKSVISLLRSPMYLEQLQRKDGEQQGQSIGQPAAPMEIEIWLVGEHGNQLEHETIKGLADRSPYSVKFLRRLNQPRLTERMNQAGVFVPPSFYEGLPLMVIEALACGLRVVCTDLPGVRPWLEENIGTCVVKFVSLPTIVNADEPVGQELPQFERHLAETMTESLKADGSRREVDSGKQGPDNRPSETPGGESLAATDPSTAPPLPGLSRIFQTGIGKKILESCNLM